MTANAGKPWCATQDAQLLELARLGKTVAEVAQHMGRTQAGIVGRAYRLSYRLTSTDQHRLLSAFIESASKGSSSAATTPATHGVTEAIEGAMACAPGLQARVQPRLLLEVQTEQFYRVMNALGAAGFEVKFEANKPARYVVNDPIKQGESV
jgi:hypothetical protein